MINVHSFVFEQCDLIINYEIMKLLTRNNSYVVYKGADLYPLN